MKKIYLISGLFCLIFGSVNAATVVATVDGVPITDTDITARTQLMARQGNTATDNMRQALQNIIDDNVKLKYAANFNVVPTDKDADAELKRMNLDGLSASEMAMARKAMKANMAWQVIVARTIMPTVEVTKEDITAERVALSREHGLPVEMTMVRLVGVPENMIGKLGKPKDCDEAVEIVQNLGGYAQQFTAMQYELSEGVRSAVANLPNLTWSAPIDDSIFLVCKTKKSKEYGKLDDVIKQNAIYKQSMFIADQQLKQLRRKSVIIINDNRYKL